MLLYFIYVLSYNHTQLPMGNKHSSCEHSIRFIILIVFHIAVFLCCGLKAVSHVGGLTLWVLVPLLHILQMKLCLSVCSHRYLDFVFPRLRWYDREGPENHSA